MTRDLFFSDLHLDREPDAVSDALFELLNRFETIVDRVFILGDLFEYWIGDDDDFVVAESLARRLAVLDADVYFQHGNRDFLVGRDYASRAGFTLLPETFVTRVAGQPTLLMHGDSLCLDDTEYLAFRARARDPEWQRQMLALPLAARQAEALRLRTASREAQQGKTMQIMDVHPRAVAQALDDSGAQRLIHGHTHRPARHALPDGRERIVLPAWDQIAAGRPAGYLLAEDEHLSLCTLDGGDSPWPGSPVSR